MIGIRPLGDRAVALQAAVSDDGNTVESFGDHFGLSHCLIWIAHRLRRRFFIV